MCVCMARHEAHQDRWFLEGGLTVAHLALGRWGGGTTSTCHTVLGESQV